MENYAKKIINFLKDPEKAERFKIQIPNGMLLYGPLVPNRSKINNSSESGEENEYLSQMNKCGKDRIFVIASSNRPDLIDPAILRKRRMDKVIFIPVSDKEARQGIFKIHMKDRPAPDDIDYARLAEMTENLVASDIAYIINDAATRAFEDDVDISQSLLEEVISENNSSVSFCDLKAYEEMRKKMEEPGVKQERRRIDLYRINVTINGILKSRLLWQDIHELHHASSFFTT